MQQSAMNQIDQTLLQDLPLGLLLLDQDGRITWLSDAMSELLDIPANELIGKSAAQLPQSAQSLLAAEPGLFQIGGSGRWVNREMRRVADGQQLFSALDVSAQKKSAEENARLQQQVEDLKLTDELTGMPNKRAISQALELHLSRSRRYLNPLSTVLVHIDLQSPDGVQPLSTDPAVLSVSRFLRDRLRWVDQIARWEDNLFLLVLPETNGTDARRLLAKIAAEQDGMLLPELCGNVRPRLTFGLACWTKGDDMRTLLRHTLNDLRENSGV